MNRDEVLAEVRRLIDEALYEDGSGWREDPAEKVLSFLDDIGYDAGPELELAARKVLTT